jgi:predicted Zn-dependent protease
MLISEKRAKAVCEMTLTQIRAEDAQVSVETEDYSHLRFAANAFTTNGRRDQASVSVTVWIDKKRGAARATNLEKSSIKMAVEQAEELARLSPVDKEYLPTLAAQTYRPSGGYADATVNLSLATRAKAIDEIIRLCEREGVIGAGFHHSSGSASASATKNGNFYYRRSSLASLSVTARHPDGSSSGYFLRNHFDVGKLDTTRIGRAAIKKAISSKGSQSLEPGVYPVILEPQAAGDLLRLGFDARSADEGRSAFSAPGGKTKLGEKVFDERIQIYSDPWHQELPASPVAAEGIPAKKIHFIRNGVLENLEYSRYWGKEKAKEPTPGPTNTIIESSAAPATLEEMIQSMNRGLLISRFWYIRLVDPRTALFTGLTRDGVWLVEKGRIQYPVRNFRFNQSLIQLLAPGNVEEIGRAERISSSESQGQAAAMVPALSVKRFSFTSQSEAV